MPVIAKEREKNMVQLEINLDKLEALFQKGELCAADVRCLNCVSKACIRNMCLNLSARGVYTLPSYEAIASSIRCVLSECK